MLLLVAHRVELEVPYDDDRWCHRESTRSLSKLQRHLLILWSRLWVGSRTSWSLPNSFDVPSATGKMKCSPLCGVDTSFALILRGWISDTCIFSNSSKSAIKMSPFQILSAINAYPRKIPGKTFLPNWWSLDWSRTEMEWYSTNQPKGILGPLNGSPNRLSYGVFSYMPESLGHFADSNSIPQNQPTIFHPILIVNSYCWSSFFHSAHCPVSTPICLNLMIHLPRFLCFCNYCCFAGIVAEANCTPTHCRGNVCLPSVRVCNAPYNFQSRFCNRPLISCSIHGVDELY